jgi:hypothetical protein
MLKLFVILNTVKTIRGFNREIAIAIKFRHCQKLLLVSILKSIVNLGTVESY